MRSITKRTPACVLLLAIATVWTATATFAAAPRPVAVRPVMAKPAGDPAAVTQSSNAFALALYKQLAAQEKGNLFFSPGSVHAALSMTYAGARGQTAAQMVRVLSLPGPNWPQPRLHKAYGKILQQLAPPEKAGYALHIANALWAQENYRFLPEFLTLNQENYGAGLQRVDFKGATEAARKTINTWVEKQTQDKIKELLKPGILTSLTRLVLTNAIYFKGDWATQFDKKRTRDMPFRLSAGGAAKVPMMYQTQKFGYTEGADFQMLQMPYKGDDLSMVVLLPRKVGGLAAMCEKLDATKLSSLLARAGRRKTKVRVWLPRFKLTSQFRLDQVLKSMGMVDAFTGAADLSGMNGRKDLYIQAVVHKAFVDVNEEGTEAAAATAVVVGRKSAGPRIPFFRADHPFLFLIRHNKTGTILFLGRVMNPKQ